MGPWASYITFLNPGLCVCKTVPASQGCCKDEKRCGGLNTVASTAATKLAGGSRIRKGPECFLEKLEPAQRAINSSHYSYDVYFCSTLIKHLQSAENMIIPTLI